MEIPLRCPRCGSTKGVIEWNIYHPDGTVKDILVCHYRFHEKVLGWVVPNCGSWFFDESLETH